jgi:aminomethyltransferase
MTLLTTPFHARTAALNRLNNWGAWAGYTTARCYGDTAMEHTALRNTAGLIDISPMVKYRITGPDAVAYLNRLTLRDVAKLAPGRVQYTAWCDDAGHLLDDGTLFHLAAGIYLLCCQERHLPWLLDSAAGFDVGVADISDDLAVLAVQGPCAAWALRMAGLDVGALKPFQVADLAFQGGTISISRTGFTGDLGYEVWVDPSLALPLWDAVMTGGALRGVCAVGADALNLARIEAGFIITNMDFVPADQAVREDRARMPQEMGLDWMIAWDKGHFTGRRALRGQGDWALVALDIDGNVGAEGALIYADRKVEVGVVTSGAWSPTTKRSIALAQVKRSHANSPRLWVEVYAPRELQYAKLMLKATPTQRPFFTHPRRRATPPGDT